MQPKAKSTEPAAAEWVPIGSLRPWADNPRKNDGAPVKKVAESIKRFGFASPIIARMDGEIIAGHTRWKAAQELGLDRVPVRFMDLDPVDSKLLAIADNRVAEEAEWDEAILAKLLGEMEQQGVDISVTGFDDGEVNRLLSEKGDNDAEAEWLGMPEFVADDQLAWKSIKVNFGCAADLKAFAELVGQNITEDTRSISFPKLVHESVVDKAYVVAEP